MIHHLHGKLADATVRTTRDELARVSGGRSALQAALEARPSFAETRPVHGECGGYMAMGAGLVDAQGVRHRMAGLLGLVTSFEIRKMHLGYRLARLRTAVPGQVEGSCLAGHEFHYSTIVVQPDAPLAEVTDATGAAVAETGSTRRQAAGGLSTGTFFHLIAEAQ